MRKPESRETSAARFLEKAMLLAHKAGDEDEVPVGALVIIDGKIVGRGYNRRESKNDPCGHAEIFALQSAARKIGSWRLIDSTLVVTLEPCPMCLAACQQARVASVIYGAKDPKGGAISLGYPLHQDVRMNHRFEVVFEEFAPASAILKAFFKARRK